MEKSKKFFENVAKLIEQGIFSSKDLKKEVENALKFKMENIANKLNFVSREEFEIQKKMVEKLQQDLNNLKSYKKVKKLNKKTKKAKKF